MKSELLITHCPHAERRFFIGGSDARIDYGR